MDFGRRQIVDVVDSHASCHAWVHRQRCAHIALVKEPAKAATNANQQENPDGAGNDDVLERHATHRYECTCARRATRLVPQRSRSDNGGLVHVPGGWQARRRWRSCDVRKLSAVRRVAVSKRRAVGGHATVAPSQATHAKLPVDTHRVGAAARAAERRRWRRKVEHQANTRTSLLVPEAAHAVRRRAVRRKRRDPRWRRRGELDAVPPEITGMSWRRP